MIKKIANLRMNDLPDEQMEAFKNLYMHMNEIIFDEFYKRNIRPDVAISVLSIIISDAMVVIESILNDETIYKGFIDGVLNNIKLNTFDKIEKRKNRG